MGNKDKLLISEFQQNLLSIAVVIASTDVRKKPRQ